MSATKKTVGVRKRGGFTLVELLIAASIAGTVAVVGVSYGNGFKNSQNNAQRLTDVDVLSRAAESHFLAKGDYPEPTGNRVYFDSKGAYAHSEKGAFGVSSSATSDLFGADFLADVPTDPDTGNAYGYGKRKDGVAGYDFASVDRRGSAFYAHVRGNSDGAALSSLVREYSGPGFVEDGSADRLPYDPYDTKITARITSYQGSVTVEPAKSLTGKLSEDDVIKIPAGGFVVVHVSDGTEVRIGSNLVASEAKFQELARKDDKKFLTKVRLALSSGEIWAKAPKLRTDRGDSSELEIVSDGVVASVRGTVFGVSKTGNKTEVSLVTGKLALTKDGKPATIPGSPDGTVSVPDGGQPVKVSFEKETPVPPAAPAPEAGAKLEPWEKGSQGVKAEVKSVSRDGASFKVAFDNSPEFTRVVLDVAKYLPNGTNTIRSVSGTGTVEVTFPVAGLPGYPKAEDASKMVRLPLRFETSDGTSAEAEFVLQSDRNVESEIESLPKGGGMECDGNSAWFPKLGCQPKSLRLYAPFDEFSDDGKSGNLGAFDRAGRSSQVMTDGIVRNDAEGNRYFNVDGSTASAPSGATGFRKYPATGVKGVTVSKWSHKPFVAYDLAQAGIGTDFSIDVGIQLSGLRRKFADLEKLSGEPGTEGAKFAYLWSLGDGTSAYLRSGDEGSRFLILKNSSGSVAASIQLPDAIDAFRDQKAHVLAVFLQENGSSFARIALFLEDVSGPYAASALKPIPAPKPDRLFLGSTFPIRNGSNFTFESQWGGASGSESSQPIDYLKVSSYEGIGTKGNSETLPVGSKEEVKVAADPVVKPAVLPKPADPVLKPAVEPAVEPKPEEAPAPEPTVPTEPKPEEAPAAPNDPAQPKPEPLPAPSPEPQKPAPSIPLPMDPSPTRYPEFEYDDDGGPRRVPHFEDGNGRDDDKDFPMGPRRR